MVAFDANLVIRPPLHKLERQPMEPMLPHEMEHIRKVLDKPLEGKKFAEVGAVVTPREDAKMFRSRDSHAVPCECIAEMYELLWRWGHTRDEPKGFEAMFGFSVPDTVVIVKGRPYAWYFISKKDGRLLRKTDEHLPVGSIEKKFCRDDGSEGGAIMPGSTWYPQASQFPEARSHTSSSEFLSVTGTRHFLSSLRPSHSGVLQAWVDPHGASNFLVRTAQFRDQTSLCIRTNRSLLASGRGALMDRCATFEGWSGLSSSCSRYRCHKHPHMEELILASGEMLNQRIEEERVRQMLFLGPTQHVALHFKVSRDHTLFFVYGSVVSEHDVILQTRPQLLMGDPCMTDALAGAALLPGGSARKAPRYEPTPRTMVTDTDGSQLAGSDALHERSSEGSLSQRGAPRAGSLPPIERPSPRGLEDPEEAAREASLQRARRRQRQVDRLGNSTLIPRMAYPRPEVPQLPYTVHPLAHDVQEAGRFEYAPPFVGHAVKRPLVTTLNSARAPAEPVCGPASRRPLLASSGPLAPPQLATSRLAEQPPHGGSAELAESSHPSCGNADSVP